MTSDEFVEWVATHRLVPGVYADAEHPYAEWVTPDDEEASLDGVITLAREVYSQRRPAGAE